MQCSSAISASMAIHWFSRKIWIDFPKEPNQHAEASASRCCKSVKEFYPTFLSFYQSCTLLPFIVFTFAYSSYFVPLAFIRILTVLLFLQALINVVLLPVLLTVLHFCLIRLILLPFVVALTF